MNRFKFIAFLGLCFGLLFTIESCKPDDIGECEGIYDCTPYVFESPYRFPDLTTPTDNPLTEQKVELGRMLFYEELLSETGTTSCGSCHQQESAFADFNAVVSQNDAGSPTVRNASHLVNMAWMNNGIFWDGRVNTIEEAVLDAIVAEQHLDWGASLTQIGLSEDYKLRYQQSFPDGLVNQDNTIRAIASFLRIVVSKDAKIDQFFRGEYTFTPLEQFGFDSIFLTEKGDCFHCHGVYPFLTDNDFHNNGLQGPFTNVAEFNDIGLALSTGLDSDYGRMKTPSLRNISYTAPYMHDGSLATLDDVIDFYSSGLHTSPTIDPLMKKVNQGGIQLSDYEKEALKAFLLTFDDQIFINNEEFSDPN